MPLVATRGGASASALGWSSAPQAEELGGMVLLTPTSVDITGGGSETATTNPNGSVTFSACETLSLNGVFTTDYDNYMVALRHVANDIFVPIYYRMRASGSDNSTANSYVNQLLGASSTTIEATRSTAALGRFINSFDVQRSGTTGYFYGPYLAQPTALRTVGVLGESNAALQDWASTHNQSVSYDGFSFRCDYSAGQTITGLVSVYGLVGA